MFAIFESDFVNSKGDPFERMDEMLVSVKSVGYILKTATYYVQTYVGDAFVVGLHYLDTGFPTHLTSRCTE